VSSASLDDRAAVTDLVYRYAHAVDARDVEGIVSCFADDARVAFNGGERVAEGRAALREFFVAAFEGPLLGQRGASTHVMGNVLVTVDGDIAHSEAHAVAYLASDARPEVVVRGLTYSDDCVRDGGSWLIRERTHAAVWQAAMPRQATSPALGEPAPT
jgi:uncharacterized protein (TIGR02246 family)